MNHFRPRPAVSSMAETLANVGRQLPPQDVRIVSRDTFAGITTYFVQVNNGPERYWVSERYLAQLRRGLSPEYLELEDAPDAVPEQPEYANDDRMCSAADAAYQSRKEQF